MPHAIVGLKYQAPYKKVNTEEQLLEIFSELKEFYSKVNSHFVMTTSIHDPITDFADFLEAAKQPTINLVGSGDIGGIVVQDARLSYDVSQVAELMRYWDQFRNGSCHSCLDQKRDYDAQEWVCDKQDPMKWKDCPQYNARLKNAQGEPARTLAELIAEAAK